MVDEQERAVGIAEGRAGKEGEGSGEVEHEQVGLRKLLQKQRQGKVAHQKTKCFGVEEGQQQEQGIKFAAKTAATCLKVMIGLFYDYPP
jgi:hypothetical protein